MRTGLAALSCFLVAGLASLQRRAAPGETPEPNGILKLEFGLKVQEPREWSGTLTSSAGEVLSTSGWHFDPPDRIIGSNGWSLRTRLFNDPKEKYKGQDVLPAVVLPNGVYASVQAPAQATVSVATNHGNFSFRLGELEAAGRLPFLDGDVAAIYTPPVRRLTQGEASQHDSPSVAVRGGETFVAWVTFHNEQNLVYMGRLKDGKWSTERVSERWGDYYGSAVAADGSGNMHVVWSEYREDRWRSVSRALESATGRWGPQRYVAGGGRRQMFHRMTTDASGTPWIVWQEFSSINANFDIFAASHSAQGWSAPIRISESAANDWHPAIAAAPDGAVWIAWDGYDQGNYDVFLRDIRNERPGPLVRVTQAETFDAHVSVAVDPKNRVWLAWEEAGANWGKDTGVLGNPGTPTHASREIRLVCYEDGKFREPATPLKQAVPAWLASMHEYPQLAIGANGLPYLFFRHYLHRLPTVENELRLQFGLESRTLQPWYDHVRQMWDVFVIGFNGTEWLPVRQVPDSTGRCWMQTASVLHGGKLLYVWPADGRTYADPRVKTTQIRYAEFAMADKPAADGMKPFVSERAGVAAAAPTETEDLKRVRAFRWGGLRLFRGDLHRHTDISADGMKDGDILDAYRYAMDAASLDFLAVTDHSGHQRLNYYRYDWWRTRQIATLFDNPGRFVTFFGYERTVTYPGGHRNIISTRRDLEPFRISDEEFTGVESYGERLFPSLKAKGDIAIPHTTATGGGTDFRESDPQAEPLVEIFQGLRGSYEEPNTPIRGAGAQYPAGLVWSAWAKGLKLGVIADSDHQSTHQSYACVYAPEFTAQAIHAAMKQRRTFAATDNFIVKVEAAAADGKLYRMGEELASASPPELRVEVQGAAPLAKVELIGNGRILLARQPGATTESFSFRDNNPPAGTAYYYVRAVQANRQIAWSSPIWVRR